MGKTTLKHVVDACIERYGISKSQVNKDRYNTFLTWAYDEQKVGNTRFNLDYKEFGGAKPTYFNLMINELYLFTVMDGITPIITERTEEGVERKTYINKTADLHMLNSAEINRRDKYSGKTHPDTRLKSAYQSFLKNRNRNDLPIWGEAIDFIGRYEGVMRHFGIEEPITYEMVKSNQPAKPVTPTTHNRRKDDKKRPNYERDRQRRENENLKRILREGRPGYEYTPSSEQDETLRRDLEEESSPSYKDSPQEVKRNTKKRFITPQEQNENLKRILENNPGYKCRTPQEQNENLRRILGEK